MAEAGPPHGQRGWDPGWEDSRLLQGFLFGWLVGWFAPHPLTHHTACGIWFSNQKSNLCPLHWEPRVQPQNYQGHPTTGFR